MMLSDEARRRLDAHLDAVERALAAAGHSREQRRAVVDDLEAQINEMLAGRLGVGGSPTLGDVEAVLSEVDPPSAYGGGGGEGNVTKRKARGDTVHIGWDGIKVEDSGGDRVEIGWDGIKVMESGGDRVEIGLGGMREQMSRMKEQLGDKKVTVMRSERRYSRTAIWGLVCLLAPFVPVIFLLWQGYSIESIFPPVLFRREASGMVSHTSPMSLIALLGTLGTVLGWVAFFQILCSLRKLRGIRLSLFVGLFYPILLVVMLLFMLAAKFS